MNHILLILQYLLKIFFPDIGRLCKLLEVIFNVLNNVPLGFDYLSVLSLTVLWVRSLILLELVDSWLQLIYEHNILLNLLPCCFLIALPLIILSLISLSLIWLISKLRYLLSQLVDMLLSIFKFGFKFSNNFLLIFYQFDMLGTIILVSISGILKLFSHWIAIALQFLNIVL